MFAVSLVLAGIRTIGDITSVAVGTFRLVPAREDMPEDACCRARFHFREPVPRKVFGLCLTVVLLSVVLRGLLRFLAGLAVGPDAAGSVSRGGGSWIVGSKYLSCCIIAADVEAWMIFVAVSSTVPSSSLRSTRCFLVALSTGSAHFMYWRVTSRSSSITSSL